MHVSERLLASIKASYVQYTGVSFLETEMVVFFSASLAKPTKKGYPSKRDTHGHLFGTHSPWSELCLAPLRLDLCPPTRQQKVYKLWAVLTFPARSLTFGSILETTTKQMKQAKLRNRMAGANKNSIATTSMVKPKSQLGVQELLAHLPRHSIPERKKKAKTETTVLFLFLYTHTHPKKHIPGACSTGVPFRNIRAERCADMASLWRLALQS